MVDPEFGFLLRYRIHATNRLNPTELELGADERGEWIIYVLELMLLTWLISEGRKGNRMRGGY